MTEQEFWKLVSEVDVGALEDGDEEGALEPMREALVGLPVGELEAFEEHLSRKLYALDREEYATNAGPSGGSGDGFLYARCYVVARGREFYEAVRADPRKFPKSIDQWCEPLLYVHREVWADATGRDASDWDHQPSVSFETFSNTEGWPHLRR